MCATLCLRFEAAKVDEAVGFVNEINDLFIPSYLIQVRTWLCVEDVLVRGPVTCFVTGMCQVNPRLYSPV